MMDEQRAPDLTNEDLAPLVGQQVLEIAALNKRLRLIAAENAELRKQLADRSEATE